MTDDPTLRRRTVVTAVAGLSTALAGCGNRESATPTMDQTPSAASSTATPAESLDPLAPPTWTTGEKHGVITVGDPGPDATQPRVWATLTRGALTEPRFPRIDALQLRRLDYLVTDGDQVWRTHEGPGRADDGVDRSVERVTDDALLFRQAFAAGDWSLTVEYVADPARPALLADVRFEAPDDHALYVVGRTALSHGVTGDEVSAGEMLAASDDESYLQSRAGDPYPVSLGLAAADGFAWTMAAPADSDPARRLIRAGEAATDPPMDATDDTVLAGRLGTGTLATTVALGFANGADPAAAAETATAALEAGYDRARSAYRASWQRFLADIDLPASVRNDDLLAPQYRTAAMTLHAVEDIAVPGAGIASPSVPWGSVVSAATPDDVGYNFVWSRDLYQSFTALEAMGKLEAARAATEYLLTVQQNDGGFIPQNTFVDGRTRWGGEQLDNVAFPLVMAHQLRERHGIWADAAYEYADLQASANYVARSGPATEQERWEEESGYSPSTIAAEIAGLACAAREAEREDHPDDAVVWLALADAWRAGVEEWCVTQEGAAGHEPPYYVRITADGAPDSPTERSLANGGPTLDERAIIDAGFLELVRLGIRPADDPVIEQSVAVVDEAIRVETPNGPGWYRYTGDGYGEGIGPGEAEAYDATPENFGAPWPAAVQGKGRLWPIFTGERGEYELRRDEPDPTPEALLRTMARFAHPSGMIPEQVWDRPEPSPYGWEFGEGTASATPLSWSMAQFVRLAHGLDAGAPVETPAFVADRYADGPPPTPALSVSFPDSTVEQRTVTVSGKTAGEAVVVRAGKTTRRVSPDETGAFEASITLDDGRNSVTVVAVTPADRLADTGLAVEQTTVSYVG